MIILGPAGVDGDAIKGLNFIKNQGLGACEIEFTHGVRMSIDKAKQIGDLANKLNLKLSVHAPFYINLASLEKDKIESSKLRILESCERAHHMGAKYIVFHPGFIMARDRVQVYQIIKKEMLELLDIINKNKWDVVLAPETTGKVSQFGDMDELIKLKAETGCELCIDFAHLYARYQGNVNYSEIFRKIKDFEYIHSHFSGIEFGDKGEKKHLNLTRDFFKPLAIELLKLKQDITVISESPITWQDSLLMKSVLDELSNI